MIAVIQRNDGDDLDKSTTMESSKMTWFWV